MNQMDEVNSIINASGNSFHCKATKYFREKGWSTLVSPYYMDNSSNKPREIDLIAEKSWLYDDRHTGKYGTINIKLFIECKYIPQTNVFWFSDKDMLSTKNWLTSNTPFPERNVITDKHHYLATNHKVAKLFASKNMPNMENEVIYKALNQSLNAMVYLRCRESIIPLKPHRDIDILATVELPVILCNSFENFHRVEMENPSSPVAILENFQLEVNYAYLDKNKKNQNEFFLIDIVDFNKLDRFLAEIESDKDAMFEII